MFPDDLCFGLGSFHETFVSTTSTIFAQQAWTACFTFMSSSVAILPKLLLHVAAFGWEDGGKWYSPKTEVLPHEQLQLL